ncbi:MAG: nucleotide exchange factor GrpE [Arcanobacterium sp.]|nr:nucleotide exchange factor GrpE [Arcanobacterium sp.]
MAEAENENVQHGDGVKPNGSAGEVNSAAQQGGQPDTTPNQGDTSAGNVAAESTAGSAPSAEGQAARTDETTDANAADTPSESRSESHDETSEGAGVSGLSELDEALLKVAQLEEQLARRSADLYNVQQEYNGYVKRSKADALVQFELGKAKVLEGLIPVLDNAYLAREHGELEGPAGKIVAELEHTLATNFSMERFGSVGDAFDPAIHEALMHSTSADVEAEQVNVIMQPGYRAGEKVLRPARVGVVSPQ